ncbi:MAG: hypothetical protein H6662_15320 [Ardenticatenaceae bacterium]|nr:hypothetical protein [Anaerolineales bacterium]MCB8922958.1 hypothetical protein [Ardenticatenaceae bacterium]MCB8990309.1 hypothetical protein [Ardenticatenaceae bacterium]
MRKKLVVFGALVLLLVLGTAVVYGLTPIDTFNSSTQTSSADGSICTSATGTDVTVGPLGGPAERDIFVERTGGGDTVVATANTVANPNGFSFSIGTLTTGRVIIQWDGTDGACTLNDRGLAPLSLNPDDGISMLVEQVDTGTNIILRVYTNSSDYSTFTYPVPYAIDPPNTEIAYFPFESFTDIGNGADFSDVGAIEVEVSGSSLDFALDFVNSDLTRDFGDLPSAYDNITLFANDGARHIPGNVYLGLGIDTDADGQTSPTATGDNTDGTNDEQGINATTGSNWGDGGGQFAVNATVPAADTVACLVGWIDWDNSGSFDVGGTTGGVSELVYNNWVFNGTTSQNIVTPTTGDYGGIYPPTLNARFRIFQRNADLFTALSLPLDGFGCPTGATEIQISGLLTRLARNGEVEDYQWGFSPTAVTLQSITAESNNTLVISLIGVLALALVSVGYVLYRRQTSNQ